MYSDSCKVLTPVNKKHLFHDRRCNDRLLCPLLQYWRKKYYKTLSTIISNGEKVEHTKRWYQIKETEEDGEGGSGDGDGGDEEVKDLLKSYFENVRNEEVALREWREY